MFYVFDRRRCGSWIGLLLICLWAAGSLAAGSDETLSDQAQPLRQRSEADWHQLRAATMVMEARILERRGDLAKSLRKYQRAWRLDPDALVALKQIVPLVLNLGRVSEATRYALLLTNSDLDDPFLAERMAMLMADQLEYDRSVQLYQRVLQLRSEEPESRNPIAMHFEMGRLYFLTNKYEQAAQSFGVVLDAIENPEKYQLSADVRKAIFADPGLVYALIAESFLEAGKYEDAKRIFRKAGEAGKTAGWLSFQIARVDYRAGRYGEAQEKLEGYVNQKLKIGGWTPYQLLQSLIEKAESKDPVPDKPSVIGRFRDWLTDDPENFPLLSFVADLTRRSGGLSDAAALYEDSIANQPTIEAYQGLIATYRQLGQVDKLLRVLGRVTSELQSLEAVADEVKEIVNDQDLLHSVFAAGRRDFVGQDDVHAACGLIALAARQYDVADAFFANLSQSQEHLDLYVTWGLELLSMEEYARAAVVFKTALQMAAGEPREAALCYYFSGALQLDGHTEAALEMANRAIALAKDNPDIALRPAWILYNADRIDAADAEYSKWLAKHTEDYSTPGIRETVREAKLVMSNICMEQKRSDEAEEWLEQILDEFPRDVGASNDLGYLLADQGKSLERATKLIRFAVDSEPTNTAYRDSLGWVLFKAGAYQEAVVELQQAASDEPPDPIILDHLGDALLAAGEHSSAIQSWKKALELAKQELHDALKLKIKLKLEQQVAESR